MSLFREFKTDAELEAKGVEFTYTGGDGKPIFQVRLARSGGSNKKYDQVRERVTAPYRRLAKLTDETRDAIAREVFSEAVVVAGTWKTYDAEKQELVPGIETEDGIVPATPETIAKVMGQLPDLYELLVRESMLMDNYKKEARDQDSKN